jgi:RHS repeat-associated protein
VTQVRKITATVKKDLIYIYDGAGERIAKKELDYLASGDSSWVTYYVRDAGEKVIAVYRQKLHYNGDSIPCPPGMPGSGSDFDADGFDETPPEFCDNCNSTQSPSLPPEYSRRNPWQEDYDGDGIGDACDPCPFGPGDECGTPLSDTAVVRMSKWKPSGFAVLAEWHIYGSSIQGRVGIWKPEKNRDTSLVSDTIFTRILTMKEYELKDHLGNVTLVISDLKTASTGGSAPYPFGVDVKSFSHYYPFGMLHPGAFGSNREYRFGYNGKESDNDWKGEGNVYDYGFRVYDPRIGKFLSVDPLAPDYPWYTPYQFAGNMPISMIDRDGLEPYNPTQDYRIDLLIQTSLSVPEGRDLNERLGMNGHGKFNQDVYLIPYIPFGPNVPSDRGGETESELANNVNVRSRIVGEDGTVFNSNFYGPSVRQKWYLQFDPERFHVANGIDVSTSVDGGHSVIVVFYNMDYYLDAGFMLGRKCFIFGGIDYPESTSSVTDETVNKFRYMLFVHFHEMIAHVTGHLGYRQRDPEHIQFGNEKTFERIDWDLPFVVDPSLSLENGGITAGSPAEQVHQNLEKIDKRMLQGPIYDWSVEEKHKNGD